MTMQTGRFVDNVTALLENIILFWDIAMVGYSPIFPFGLQFYSDVTSVAPAIYVEVDKSIRDRE